MAMAAMAPNHHWLVSRFALNWTAMIRIATWNINSIKVRLEPVKDWLAKHQPDLLLLQEIKCKTESFPSASFQELGYHSTVLGQPGYNGVAILSREPVKRIASALPFEDPLARFLDIEWNGLRVINIYAPNGNPVASEKFMYKLKWLEHLISYIEKLRASRTPFLVAGDYNIIPAPIDARHPENWIHDALYQPESQQMWQRLCNLGLTDAYRALYPTQANAYTFWDYQAGSWPRDNGIRIDHALLAPQLADRLTKAWIDKEPRAGERPSDHTPLVIEID
jgi:exodeoxyribonuclease-3